jgi:5'-3' exonuclease
VRLHLVDGTYELFRAHFSPGPSRVDGDGRDVKATVGLASMLLGLLDDAGEEVTHLAVAFDNPIVSFRNDMFDGYKDGADVDETLLAQFDRVEDVVAALGVTVWSMDVYEADDALATAAVSLADQVEQVRILTPDKDLGQVVSGHHIVQVDRGRRREYDEEGVVARLGVAPASVPDHLALVGDTADGIPGLPGFGAKTSATLLQRYGHLEDIPDTAADWDVPVRGAARLAATLAERRDDAMLYRDLATLRTDVPLTDDVTSLAWEGADADAWSEACAQLGSERLRDRPSRWRGP